MSLLPLSELPRYLKQHILVPPDAQDKSALDAALVILLEDYFSVDRLLLDGDVVVTELNEIRQWRAETVLAKLRSLLEKQARRDIQQYCSSLSKESRGEITQALHRAGLHHFRENLETDLYVGIHTAISANFKMFGVLHLSSPKIPSDRRDEALAQLLRALRCIATQPLGVLVAFDGIFWDSKLYSIPDALCWQSDSPSGYFAIDSAVLEKCVAKAVVDEVPTGCPAMRARTKFGVRAIDFVQNRCIEVANKYYSQPEKEKL